MKKFLGLSATLLLVVFMAQTAGAAIIEYDATFLGGDRWQYDYTIFNNSSDDVIASFDITYSYPGYDNLELLNMPGDWYGLADNGFDIGGIIIDGILVASFDGYGLLPGEDAGIFSVVFDWFGNGAPGIQTFMIYDGNWGVIGDGEVVERESTEPIPEPQTFMLLGTGILGLAAYYRTRKGKR